jgi:hypothetical protein
MDAAELIASREHRIVAARRPQLTNNLLARFGGRPYIDARLWRAPNESDASWDGHQGRAGRKDRTHLVNDAGRIVQKIGQYLFAEDATREGGNDAWLDDVTATGKSVRQFWQDVSDLVTVSGWCWIQADRGAPEYDPETRRPRQRTIAQREAQGDRLHWSAWSALEVVDWHFDKSGRLLWLLTAETRYENSDAMMEAKTVTERTLWRADAGGATWQRWVFGADGKAAAGASGTVSTAEIPFMLVGEPTTDPWWFDDVEAVQASLLNLGSLHMENIVRSVYPQLVIPASMATNLEAKLIERAGDRGGAKTAELVREIVRGLEHPFTESTDDKGLTRYLQPSAADLDAIPAHADRLRRQAFDMVGLALFNRETRQVQTAESKQFDHLDTESTLRHRALLLQDAETRLVAMSKAIDSTFAEYAATWPQKFNVPTPAEDVAILSQIASFAELPPTMLKQMRRTALRMLDQVERVDAETKAAILEEIDAMDEEPPDTSTIAP